jgi:hypothetical protein
MKPCQTFIKRKHPRKGEKKKQGARTKFHSNKQPKRHRWFCGHLLVSFLTNLGLSKWAQGDFLKKPLKLSSIGTQKKTNAKNVLRLFPG